MKTKDRRLEFRTNARQRALLIAASEAEGTSLSDFVLKYATSAAENVLADRRIFQLAAERYEAFAAMVDRPERELPRLRKLLESQSVFDET